MLEESEDSNKPPNPLIVSCLSLECHRPIGLVKKPPKKLFQSVLILAQVFA